MKLIYFKVVTVALALVALLPPLVYWINHPHLSHMEVFLRMWPFWVGGLLGQAVLLMWEARRARGDR